MAAKRLSRPKSARVTEYRLVCLAAQRIFSEAAAPAPDTLDWPRHFRLRTICFEDIRDAFCLCYIKMALFFIEMLRIMGYFD